MTTRARETGTRRDCPTCGRSVIVVRVSGVERLGNHLRLEGDGTVTCEGDNYKESTT